MAGKGDRNSRVRNWHDYRDKYQRISGFRMSKVDVMERQMLVDAFVKRIEGEYPGCRIELKDLPADNGKCQLVLFGYDIPSTKLETIKPFIQKVVSDSDLEQYFTGIHFDVHHVDERGHASILASEILAGVI